MCPYHRFLLLPLEHPRVLEEALALHTADMNRVAKDHNSVTQSRTRIYISFYESADGLNVLKALRMKFTNRSTEPSKRQQHSALWDG